jgi:hypothetical protein
VPYEPSLFASEHSVFWRAHAIAAFTLGLDGAPTSSMSSGFDASGGAGPAPKAGLAKHDNSQ